MAQGGLRLMEGGSGRWEVGGGGGGEEGKLGEVVGDQNLPSRGHYA